MRGIPLIFSVILLIMAMKPGIKAVTEEEMQKAMKRNIELGFLAIEPPILDDVAVAFEPIQKQEEEDRDHLHHPRDRTEQKYQKKRLRMPQRKILNGPEEDRDHLYHPR